MNFLPAADLFVTLDDVQALVESRVRRLMKAWEKVGVIHEVAPDQVMVISQTTRPYARRGQQQPGVLDPAAGQHIVPGWHCQLRTIQACQDKACHPPRVGVGQDLHQVRVQVDVDVAGGSQALAIRLPEIGGMTELVITCATGRSTRAARQTTDQPAGAKSQLHSLQKRYARR